MATDPTAVPSNDDWLADYDRAEQLVVASEPPLQPRLRPPELVRELESVWISTAPPADDLQPASFAAHGREPVNVYCYTDKLGVPIGYVCRFEDPKTGKKDIRPWSYGKIQGDDADR